ncbi:hypothetical protein RHMOL_Rhmol09G0268500 [Rhododendron molle]|uniref:Uncharacterized protein n=2 Tax=Rhododendron TaxID=4346 RepID=A0A834GE77_RHOSS|nr:hypothetical protein RHSIM_Rhsim09G0207000 [Rhododendron simsii]KAI8540500.1 hypothetical protein RHMOL_Rhmol09G0268500 [Rhododendron molle]
MDNSSGVMNDKIDGWASWLGMSVASAFFASLERCSCVNLSTSDSDDENEEEAKDRPLMFTNYQINQDNAKNPSSVNDLPV